MNWKKTLLISMLILLAGAAVTVLIFSTEPTAERGGATRETAMLVEVTGVEKGDFRPTIVTTGTVQPDRDILLSPRVSGEIVYLSPAFVPGGFVRKGQTLLRIDPADYENTLRLRQSDLRQAQADLSLEKGQQEIARQDYRLLGDSLSPDNRSLVLREPQLESVKARVEAARASVAQARLALERTTVKAPFDAHILTRNVNLGSQVAPGDNLARLVGTDRYWVTATVPLSQLRRLRFPENGTRGPEVRLRNRAAWPEGVYRTGYLYKLVGALDQQTRLARVMVEVPDPLAYRTDAPGLIIGAFLETHIEGEAIEDVVRLNRDYLRDNETVWVMEDGQLRIREVDIVFRDARYAYIRAGLSADARVVTTNLSTVTEGAALRLERDSTAAPADTTHNTAQQGQAAPGL